MKNDQREMTQADLQSRIERWKDARSRAVALLAKAELAEQRRHDEWREVKSRALIALNTGVAVRREQSHLRTPTSRVIRKTHLNAPLAQQNTQERLVTEREALALADEVGLVTGRLARQIDELRDEVAELRDPPRPTRGAARR